MEGTQGAIVIPSWVWNSGPGLYPYRDTWIVIGVCQSTLHVFCVLGEGFGLCPLLQKCGVLGPLLQAMYSYKLCPYFWQEVKHVFNGCLALPGVVPCHNFSLWSPWLGIQCTAGGESAVESVDFKIASLLFACCRNPENGEMDGRLMDFVCGRT